MDYNVYIKIIIKKQIFMFVIFLTQSIKIEI
jgi:hypothetical protein